MFKRSVWMWMIVFVGAVCFFPVAGNAADGEAGAAAVVVLPEEIPPAQMQEYAAQGDPAAQYYLGVMYVTGNGFEQNLEQAVVWYKKAADQGIVQAAAFLAEIYSVGRKSIPRDLTEGLRWYIRTADLGSSVAREFLRDMLAQDDRLEALIYPDDPKLFRDYVEVTGVDINSPLSKDGPGFAHIAVKYNSLKILEEMGRMNADLDIKWNDGSELFQVPLGMAAANRNIEAMRVLLESGADPNGGYGTPLHMAVIADFVAGVQLLLEYTDLGNMDSMFAEIVGADNVAAYLKNLEMDKRANEAAEKRRLDELLRQREEQKQ